jgi:hypothetical protein
MPSKGHPDVSDRKAPFAAFRRDIGFRKPKASQNGNGLPFEKNKKRARDSANVGRYLE